MNTGDCRFSCQPQLYILNSEQLNSEIYVKSPYVRGYNLWKQLPPQVQKPKTIMEFNQLLLEDLMSSINE